MEEGRAGAATRFGELEREQQLLVLPGIVVHASSGPGPSRSRHAWKVRYAAVSCLANKAAEPAVAEFLEGAPGARNSLARCLDDEEAMVRKVAAHLLCRLPAACLDLRELCRDGAAPVKYEGSAELEDLYLYARHADPLVRLTVARALVATGTQDRYARLVFFLMRDEHEAVRAVALEAVRAMGEAQQEQHCGVVEHLLWHKAWQQRCHAAQLVGVLQPRLQEQYVILGSATRSRRDTTLLSSGQRTRDLSPLRPTPSTPSATYTKPTSK